MEQVDVLVVGAGTAGAAAARACARAGLRVRCVDAAPLDRAGARWINGMPLWAFDEGDLPRPRGEELHGEGNVFHILAGWGPRRVSVDARGFAEVDMRHLVRRLQDDARAAGARLEGECPVHAWRPEGDGARVDVDGTPVHARVVVDATGMKGAALGPRTPVPPEEICVAAHQVRRIEDPQAALRWFEGHGVPAHETLCFTGVAGGYSVLNVRLELDHDPPQVAVLTGSIPGLGHPSGVRVLEDFVSAQGWIGASLYGGARPIPLAPPAPSLVAGPVVLMGDAGRQVFAAHGSGVAAQLVAAAMLGRVLGAGGTPWDWNVAWQRQWGGELAAAGVFARFSARLTVDELERLVDSGLMAPSASRDTLLQQLPRLRPRDLPGMAAGVVSEPGLVARMGPVLGRMARVRLHGRRYPDSPQAVPRWTRKRDRLLGR